ncbi:hypothetical protein MATL_G00042850 [Megalops atlanticus]|uniref:Hexosyltransferase n=1 Tax=Megalops atlanticus TaxID=7932 RepID=A0A9D3QBD1_MEGAT|nr:hypothetical protein MATL_G00042850 [Megalops atlanticus]
MRYSRVLLTLALTSSLALFFLYSPPKTKEGQDQEWMWRPERNVNDPPKVKLATPPEKKSTPLPEPQSNPIPIEISEKFRQAIPQSSAFWNRKQHFLFRQNDWARSLKGNASEWERQNKSSCTPVSREVLRTNIQDFDSYPALYKDFLQGMDCRDPPILIDQPSKCHVADGQGQGQLFLLFAIKSAPRNFERRQAIRETWGQEGAYEGGLKVRMVFLLGKSSLDEPNLDQLLHYEAQHFKDLLQWDFQDSFYNLTLKENAFYSWALQRCSHVKFIFKGDDDVFVNPQAMIDYLRALETQKASKLYVGQVVTKASPFRDSKSKYYVPHSFYEGPYPSYAGVGGFLFAGSLLKPLYQLAEYIAFFPIDDVYTGMCFQALGIDPVVHSSFYTFDIREQDRENACVHRNLLLVHQRSPQQTMRLWKNMLSPLLTC